MMGGFLTLRILDGWIAEARKLTDKPFSLDYILSQIFRRDWTDPLPSKWDVTVEQMARRVAATYGI